jgi:hypothetical protein
VLVVESESDVVAPRVTDLGVDRDVVGPDVSGRGDVDAVSAVVVIELGLVAEVDLMKPFRPKIYRLKPNWV